MLAPLHPGGAAPSGGRRAEGGSADGAAALGEAVQAPPTLELESTTTRFLKKSNLVLKSTTERENLLSRPELGFFLSLCILYISEAAEAHAMLQSGHTTGEAVQARP